MPSESALCLVSSARIAEQKVAGEQTPNVILIDWRISARVGVEGLMNQGLAALITALMSLPFWAAFVLAGFGLWRSILGSFYDPIGWRPLTLAYILCGATLLVATLVVSDADGGFATFAFFIDVCGTSFWISLAGVPAAALLVRIDALGYGAATVMVLVYSILGAALTDWEFLIFLAPSSIAFFIGLTVAVRRRQRADDAASSQRATASPRGAR
jgi:hypothetical protein